MLLALLILTLPATGTARAAHDGRAIVPTISSSSTNQGSQSALIVTGADFTPGGDVFIAIYDRWGNIARESRWTTASTVPMTTNGVADPAHEITPGGVIVEAFDAFGEQLVTVRAFNRQTAAWSNPVDVTIGQVP
jgi:hypothetical protein